MLQKYIIFHTSVELISVAVAWGVCLLVWNARKLNTPKELVFLGLAYAQVGLLDLLHAMAYEGLNVFGNSGANMATQLWIAARITETIAIFCFALSKKKKLNFNPVIKALSGVNILFIAAIFWWDIFPDCFLEASGLTAFKKNAEYLIITTLSLSALFIWKHRKPQKKSYTCALLLAAIICTIFSEISFTLYAHPYGTANMVGHLLKKQTTSLSYL
jgi:hypothetical protein